MILLCNSAAVTEDFAKAAESLNNMLIGVAYDDNTDTACLVLRDHRLLYSIYRMYTDTESDEILSGSYARFAEEMHCPFVAVLADPGCSASVRENVYKAVVGARVAQKYRTIPMAVQYFRGSFGHVQMGPMMASIMIDIIPIVIVYLVCQKYIIEGVVAGAVKG